MSMKYIIKDKGIQGGSPVIVGTRIMVEHVVNLIKQGYDEGKLKQDFPYVNRRVLRGVVNELVSRGLQTIV